MSNKTTLLWLFHSFICLVIAPNEQILSKFIQSDYEIKDWRMTSTNFNKQVFIEYSMKTFRYNKTTRAANVTVISKIDLEEHDIKGFAQVYKRYRTKYIEFPIYMEIELCQLATYNIAGAANNQCGVIKCPYRKNVLQYVCNWIPEFSRLPPLIPEGEYLVQFNFTYLNQPAVNFEFYGRVYRKVKIL